MLVKLFKILGIISGAAIAAIGVTGGSANAATPWGAVYLHAISGNGCASYAASQRLAPIISEPCSKSAIWWFRDLSTTNGPQQPGDHYELIDSTMTYALGFSGGEVKLETINAGTTYVFMYSEAFVPGVMELSNGVYPFPNGAGLPLQVNTPSSPNTLDDWVVCPLSLNDPTCTLG
jgi:hypothetical protein